MLVLVDNDELNDNEMPPTTHDGCHFLSVNAGGDKHRIVINSCINQQTYKLYNSFNCEHKCVSFIANVLSCLVLFA